MSILNALISEIASVSISKDEVLNILNVYSKEEIDSVFYPGSVYIGDQLTIKGTSSGSETANVNCTSVDSEGAITSLDIIDYGSGYTAGESITLVSSHSKSGTGATATATVSNIIANLAITVSGLGYEVGDELTIKGTTSLQDNARLTVNEVNSNGSIESATVTVVGSGYTIGEPVEILLGNGNSAEMTATITSSIISVTIVDGGTGYTVYDSISEFESTYDLEVKDSSDNSVFKISENNILIPSTDNLSRTGNSGAIRLNGDTLETFLNGEWVNSSTVWDINTEGDIFNDSADIIIGGNTKEGDAKLTIRGDVYVEEDLEVTGTITASGSPLISWDSAGEIILVNAQSGALDYLSLPEFLKILVADPAPEINGTPVTIAASGSAYVDFTVNVKKYLANFINIGKNLPIVNGYSFMIKYKEDSSSAGDPVETSWVFSVEDSNMDFSEVSSFTVRFYRTNISGTSYYESSSQICHLFGNELSAQGINITKISSITINCAAINTKGTVGMVNDSFWPSSLSTFGNHGWPGSLTSLTVSKNIDSITLTTDSSSIVHDIVTGNTTYPYIAAFNFHITDTSSYRVYGSGGGSVSETTILPANLQAVYLSENVSEQTCTFSNLYPSSSYQITVKVANEDNIINGDDWSSQTATITQNISTVSPENNKTDFQTLSDPGWVIGSNIITEAMNGVILVDGSGISSEALGIYQTENGIQLQGVTDISVQDKTTHGGTDAQNANNECSFIKYELDSIEDLLITLLGFDATSQALAGHTASSSADWDVPTVNTSDLYGSSTNTDGIWSYASIQDVAVATNASTSGTDIKNLNIYHSYDGTFSAALFTNKIYIDNNMQSRIPEISNAFFTTSGSSTICGITSVENIQLEFTQSNIGAYFFPAGGVHVTISASSSSLNGLSLEDFTNAETYYNTGTGSSTDLASSDKSSLAPYIDSNVVTFKRTLWDSGGTLSGDSFIDETFSVTLTPQNLYHCSANNAARTPVSVSEHIIIDSASASTTIVGRIKASNLAIELKNDPESSSPLSATQEAFDNTESLETNDELIQYAGYIIPPATSIENSALSGQSPYRDYRTFVGNTVNYTNLTTFEFEGEQYRYMAFSFDIPYTSNYFRLEFQDTNLLEKIQYTQSTPSGGTYNYGDNMLVFAKADTSYGSGTTSWLNLNKGTAETNNMNIGISGATDGMAIEEELSTSTTYYRLFKMLNVKGKLAILILLKQDSQIYFKNMICNSYQNKNLVFL